MRARKTNDGLTINAVAGWHVVVLGFDIEANLCTGLRGFAVKRTDHVKQESYWMQGTKTFASVETQRQWSDTAIARTTPGLLAPFSIVTLLAARLPARQRPRIAAAAWYPKPRPTFADALAAVRGAIWRERALATSHHRHPRTKPRFRLPAPWAYALCHAA